MQQRWTAALAAGMVLVGLAGSGTLTAQQRDESGQIVNPQPHTDKQFHEEVKQEKHQLKHNKKADKAEGKASRAEDKAARERAKADAEAEKANTPAH